MAGLYNRVKVTTATAGTMIANAVRAGYDANDLEERAITDAGFWALIGAAR